MQPTSGRHVLCRFQIEYFVSAQIFSILTPRYRVQKYFLIFCEFFFQVTPLAIALMKDQIPCADYLLSLENVDVNFPDDCGRTLLCQKLNCSTLNETLLQMVTFLIDKKGADVNKADIEQCSPVGSSCVSMQPHCVPFCNYDGN